MQGWRNQRSERRSGQKMEKADCEGESEDLGGRRSTTGGALEMREAAVVACSGEVRQSGRQCLPKVDTVFRPAAAVQ